MSIQNTVEIVPFSTDLKEPFRALNIAWIKKYFEVEEKDELVLSNPQQEIIDKGGMVFYAKYNNKIVGAVALIKIDATTFELSKMAVSDKEQGLGIGNRLVEHCLKIAQESDIRKLILYSNKKLLPAIHLYKKFGFIEVALESGVYQRADIKMEKIMP